MKKRVNEFRRVLLKARIGVSKHLIVFVFFLAVMLGSGMKLIAQVDFSNRVINSDCCPKEKRIAEDIMNNAPFVFEGRMIKQVYGSFNDYYLFEIEKVYRGGERLQAGTVEIIVRMPNVITDVSRPVSFHTAWYIIFAKETDVGTFEANNSIKLELYNDNAYTPSRFGVSRDYYNGLFLNFQTKDDVRNFLTTYNLFSTDMPKADTLMTLSARDKENARKKAEEDTKRREHELTPKQYYQILLEKQWKSNRKAIEDAMQEYENASDSVRTVLLYKLKPMEVPLIDTASNRKKDQGQLKRGSDTTLILSIQNMQNTGTSSERFLEFDIMVRANTIGKITVII